MSSVLDGSYVINEEQAHFLEKKLGPNWNEIIMHRSGQPAIEEPSKDEQDQHRVPVVLHGKEYVVGKEASAYIQKKYPKLEAIGKKAVE